MSRWLRLVVLAIVALCLAGSIDASPTYAYDVPAASRAAVREFGAVGATTALRTATDGSVSRPVGARGASTTPPARFVATKWVDNAGDIRWPGNRGFAGTPVDDVLEVGTRVDRYGRPSGGFVSPQGTPYSARSLAPGTDPASLRAYEVMKPIEGVRTGQVAPWFDEVGGGIQHELPNSVQWLLDNGYLREVP